MSCTNWALPLARNGCYCVQITAVKLIGEEIVVAPPLSVVVRWCLHTDGTRRQCDYENSLPIRPIHLLTQVNRPVLNVSNGASHYVTLAHQRQLTRGELGFGAGAGAGISACACIGAGSGFCAG